MYRFFVQAGEDFGKGPVRKYFLKETGIAHKDMAHGVHKRA